jgi:cation diffusion facilitator CzcD-associated flavoprotein CzcO
MPGEKAEKKRLAAEASAKKYIYATTPEKYHEFIVPKFPLGCKRRIFDPNYLESLHSKNLSLVAEGVREFDETGIVSESGVKEDFDVIVLATGFQVQNFLTPMEIIGKTGVSLEDQWDSKFGKNDTSNFYQTILTTYQVPKHILEPTCTIFPILQSCKSTFLPKPVCMLTVR